MRLAVLAMIAAASPALAQTPPADLARYDKAPWWMDKPVIASTGFVESEIAPNRATFAGRFQSVARDAAGATKAAADKARILGRVLAAYGPETVRVETSFSMVPLYEQYRDKNGTMVDNERADKIDRYQVSANVSVEVRDVRLVEKVYATVLSAAPTDVSQVRFTLEPDNETKTQMFKLAVGDATRRARLAAEVAGARLGPVKLIDPTGRACQTDVLVAGAGRSYGGGFAERAPPPAPLAARPSVDDIIVTGPKRAAEAGLKPEDMQLPLQPPLQTLNASACVVFSLN